MKTSLLERLLVANRPRPRMAELGVFAPPVAIRYPSAKDEAPWVTSMSSGRFTLTRDKEGEVGQAFFQCPIEEEDDAFEELCRTLWELSVRHGWNNRCRTIPEALERLAATGFEAKYMAIPFSALSGVVGSDLTEEEADTLSLSKSCVAEVDGVQVLSARKALPDGAAIVTSARPLVGVYNRVQDYMGVTLFRADRALMLVSADGVA